MYLYGLILNSSYFVYECLFISCVSNSNGGAILSSNKLYNLRIDFSSFSNCSSKGLGGAVYSNNSLCEIKSCCFSECDSHVGSSLIDFSIFLSFNNSEISKCSIPNKIGYFASLYLQTSSCFSTGINSSNNYQQYQYSTFLFMCANSVVFQYYSINKNLDNDGGASIGLYMSTISGSYINIREVTTGTYGLFVYGLGGRVSLNEVLVLQKNSACPKIDHVHQPKAGDFLTFTNSVFDFDSSRFLYSSFNNCTFNKAEFGTHSIRHVRPDECNRQNEFTQFRRRRFGLLF